MSQPCSPGGVNSAATDQPVIHAPAGIEQPTFLEEDYVCTQLPMHITRARTKEQQAQIDQAYEGWNRTCAGLKVEGL